MGNRRRRNSMKRKNDLDVKYFLPIQYCKKGTGLVGCKTEYNTWYDVHAKTRPIAYSTVATKNWLELSHSMCNNWEEWISMLDGSNKEWIKDEEALQVARAYYERKVLFKDVI